VDRDFEPLELSKMPYGVNNHLIDEKNFGHRSIEDETELVGFVEDDCLSSEIRLAFFNSIIAS